MTDDLSLERVGPLAVVTLNRPAALNALTLEMIRGMAEALRDWAHDASVRAVVFKGAGGRAFCAGGDVKFAYYEGLSVREGGKSLDDACEIFAVEYCMNRLFYHYRKPLIAFMDGITMGGGVGVAAPCRFRVATANTLYAMPEVAIGFFPDVGSAYFLSRCPDEIGTYLVMTGEGIRAQDLLQAGLATHCIGSESLDDCTDALVAALSKDDDDDDFMRVGKVLERYHGQPGYDGVLSGQCDVIRTCFSGEHSEKILARLYGNGSDWAEETARRIESRSPLSVKVALDYIRRARELDFNAVTAIDYILVRNFLQSHDFFEGVRAVLVDKHKNPCWQPAALARITPEMVSGMFLDDALDGPVLDDICPS